MDPKPSVSTAPVRMLSSIGTHKYDEVDYRLGHLVMKSRVPLAVIASALGLGAVKASVFVTASADEYWPPVQEDLEKLGIKPRKVPITEGLSDADIARLLQTVIQEVLPSEQVILDVTFGLRHLPFIYLAALTYLAGLRGTVVKGVFYGALEAKGPDGVCPIVDITSLFKLTEWYHALESSKETGDLRPLAKRLRSDIAGIFKAGGRGALLPSLARSVDALASDLAMGLPLETGCSASRVISLAHELAPFDSLGGVSRSAVELLVEQVSSIAAPQGSRDKMEIVLDEPELRRELSLVRIYVERNDLPKALLLLREWMVNALLATDSCSNWLDFSERRRAEAWLNGLAERARLGLASEPQKEIGSPWQSVRSQRNRLAHAGMGRAHATVRRESVRKALEKCESLLQKDAFERALPSPEQTLLVTALGLSPGVLYSALRLVNPDRLLVLTSQEATGKIDEALLQASYQGIEKDIILLLDPYSGFREIEGYFRDRIRPLVVTSGKVVVNLAGGTTAMQYAVELIAREAVKLGATLHRVAVVDRRPPAEQKENPYVLGELLLLGREQGARGPRRDPVCYK